tara:strand:- start:1621 stop:2091 length:471 start_codon:yes stop_codon:yes gene_type:complete
MRLLSLTFIMFLAFIDYLSKALVKEYLKTDYYEWNEFIAFHVLYNKGIAFSLLNSESLLINTAITVIISFIILFILYIFLRDFSELIKIELLGYMLILGGAIGNFLDRMSNGSVLDFIILNYNQIYFPAIFNIADILISFGAFLLIYSYIFISKYD